MKRIFLFLLIALFLSTAGIVSASLMQGDDNGSDAGGYNPDTPTQFPADEEDFVPVVPEDVFENLEDYNIEEVMEDTSLEVKYNFLKDYLSLERIDQDIDNYLRESLGVDPEELRRAAKEEGLTPSEAAERALSGRTTSGRTNCPTEGLVPCGTEGCPCTLCDLFVMFSRIVNYILFKIVPIVAAFMIAVGGFMFIAAYSGKAGPDILSKAKTLFKSVVIGLILIYAAWLIVNTFFMVIGINELNRFRTLPENWWKIECESSVPSSESSRSSGPDSNTPSSGDSSTGPQHTTPTREKPETGEIVSVSDKVDSAWIGSDDITVNTQVRNTSDKPKKYRAILWDGEGGIPVERGDWVTIEPGESKAIEVSTNWKMSSMDDLTKDHYTITVSEEGGETIGRVSRPVPSH